MERIMSVAVPPNHGPVDDADLCEEIERLATEIRNKMNGTHLNVRVVWFDTLLPLVEEVRATGRSSSPEHRLATERVLSALRDFAGSL
jgi:hypothetical protein